MSEPRHPSVVLLIAISNFAISLIFGRAWRYHLRSQPYRLRPFRVKRTVRSRRGNDWEWGSFRVYYVGGVKRNDACKTRTVEVEDRVTAAREKEQSAWREEKNILYVASAVLYNPASSRRHGMGSRFIPRYTVHLLTPGSSLALPFSLALSFSPPLIRSALFFSLRTLILPLVGSSLFPL